MYKADKNTDKHKGGISSLTPKSVFKNVGLSGMGANINGIIVVSQTIL